MSQGAELARFYLSWATGLKAGLPMPQALALSGGSLAEPAAATRSKMLLAATRQGCTLEKAARRSPAVFSELEVTLIGIGEEHGRLVETLEELATFFEKEQATAARVRRKLSYPVFLALTGSAIALLPLAFWFTAGHYALALGVAWCLAALLGGGLAWKAFEWERGRPRWATARLCRLLALSLEAGLPTPRALELAARLVAPSSLAKSLRSLGSRVSMDTPLSEALARGDLLGGPAAALLDTAERTGETRRTLRYLAEQYEEGML